MRYFLRFGSDENTWIELDDFRFGVDAVVEIGSDSTPTVAGPAFHGGVTVSFADDRTATLFMDAVATGQLDGDGSVRIVAATEIDQQPANFYEIDLNGTVVSDWFDSLTGTTATLNYADIELQTRYFDYRGKLLDYAPFEWDVANNDPNPTNSFPSPTGPNDVIVPVGSASFEFFLMVDGFGGGSDVTGREGWFDATFYQIGAFNFNDEPEFQTFTVNVEGDEALAEFYLAAANGIPIAGLVLEGMRGEELGSDLTLGGLTVVSVTDLSGPGFAVEFSYDFILSRSFDQEGTVTTASWDFATLSTEGEVPVVTPGEAGPDAAPPSRFFLAIDGVAGDSVVDGHERWFNIGFDQIRLAANNGVPEKPIVSLTFESESGIGDILDLLTSGETFAMTVEGTNQGDTVYSLNLRDAKIVSLVDGFGQGYSIEFDYTALELATQDRGAGGVMVDNPVFAWDFETGSPPEDAIPAARPDQSASALLPGFSPTKYYMVIDGQNGGSTAEGYEHFFELSGFNNGFTNQGGAPLLDQVFVSVESDTGYVGLLELITRGEQIPGVRIEGVVEIDGIEKTVYELGLSDAVLTSLSDRSGPGFSMSFDFAATALATYDPETGNQLTLGGFDRRTASEITAVPEANAASSDPAGEAVRYYFAMARTNGDSLVDLLKNQGFNDVNGFSFRIGHDSADGELQGQPQFTGISIDLASSVALPDLLLYAGSGTILDGAELIGVNSENAIVYTAALDNVLVKNVSDGLGAGIGLELDFTAVNVISQLIDPQTGAAGEEVSSGWDRELNQPPSFSPIDGGEKIRDVPEPQAFHLAITGVLGDNTSEERGGWFDIANYNISFGNSGDAFAEGSGSPQFGTLDIVFGFDDGLPAMLEQISFGEAFSTAVIDGTITNDNGEEVIVRSLGVAGIFVTSIQEVADLGYRVSFAFEEIVYRVLNAKGDILDSSGWNVVEGRVGNESITAAPGGTRFADLLTGTGLDNKLAGGSGGDTLFGLDGDDTLNGGKGRDKLFGGAGDDKINGSEGDDRIAGESGKDTLTGGAGRDSFIFTRANHSPAGNGRDTITDFTFDNDVIDLSKLFKGTLFFLNGGAAITGIGQVTAIDAADNPGNDTIVLVNLAGDTAAEVEIRVNGQNFTQFLDIDFVL